MKKCYRRCIVSSVAKRVELFGDNFMKEVRNTYPNTMPPVVESIELLNRKGIYLCKKDIAQKMDIAPAAKKEGNPITINFTQSNVHTPGFWITEINLGSASKRPIKIGNIITNIKRNGLISLFFKAILNELAHTMKHPTNTTKIK